MKTISTNSVMADTKRDVKPFLKWAGGKGQLLDEIREYYPFKRYGIKKYAEPFVGGGAVLFDIVNTQQVKEIYISDVNRDLINVYTCVRDYSEMLIRLLQSLQNEFHPLTIEDRKLYYMIKRNTFNRLFSDSDNKMERVEKAALFIFLNRTCFNGLYRVNRKGEYNVPMGAYKMPIICDAENLSEIAKRLQTVTIVSGGYEKAESFIDASTFVYFDPPYRPLTATSNFTSYTENEFDDEAQRALGEFIHRVHRKGAKFLLSNSDPKNSDENDEFFDELYRMYFIRRVKAHRMINSKGNGRGKITELLISNFEPYGE